MHIQCIYNEGDGSFAWVGVDSIQCGHPSCNGHQDFLQANGTFRAEYSIGEIVTYKCPNGYALRTLCRLDANTGFGEWDFEGSCKGTFNDFT